ncbi:MAG: antibiotic biosynthesis monooxygenase [Turicibacter sp.]|nr:antibiotic biosynthesis monooxygenase [Turicibacter sp.]
MIVLVVNFEVKEGKKEEFLALIKPLIEGSQNEAGNIEYDLYVNTEKANGYILLEKWQDQAALDFHNTTEHYKVHGAKLGVVCEEIVINRFAPVG